MAVWMIEGEWSGPVSPAGDWTRVVHREYTHSEKRAQACAALAPIRYTDGTTLSLTVTQRHGGKRPPRIPGYHKLIDVCLRTGITSVDELYAKGEME